MSRATERTRGAAIGAAMYAVLGESAARANAERLIELYDEQDEGMRRRMFATLAQCANLAMGLLHPGALRKAAQNSTAGEAA